jgi:hypothetical protein
MFLYIVEFVRPKMVMCWPHSDSWMQKAAQTDQRISDASRDFMGDRVAAWLLARKKALEGAVMPLEYFLGMCAEKRQGACWRARDEQRYRANAREPHRALTTHAPRYRGVSATVAHTFLALYCPRKRQCDRGFRLKGTSSALLSDSLRRGACLPSDRTLSPSRYFLRPQSPSGTAPVDHLR